MSEKVRIKPFLATRDGELTEIYKSLNKIERVTAYVIRVTRLMRGDKQQKGSLTNNELGHAGGLCIRHAQASVFRKEVRLIKGFKGNCRIEWPKDSRIGSFHPILDEDGILRVTGCPKCASIVNI